RPDPRFFIARRRPHTRSYGDWSSDVCSSDLALFFITLIFPIQFDRQWITLGWAVEGAALCWLFHRVPHPGLRIAGIALLLTSFEIGRVSCRVGRAVSVVVVVCMSFKWVDVIL